MGPVTSLVIQQDNNAKKKGAFDYTLSILKASRKRKHAQLVYTFFMFNVGAIFRGGRKYKKHINTV